MDSASVPSQQYVEIGTGLIKAVPSGDQVVVLVLNRQVVGPPQEIELSLSNVRAPRIGITGFGNRASTEDKPFSWPAREYLRALTIGQRVNYYIEHKSDTGKCYGRIELVSNDGSPSVDVASAMCQGGWCEVTSSASTKPEVQQLLLLNDEAKKRKVGMYTTAENAAESSIRPLHTANVFALYEQLNENGAPASPAIVHEVRGGGQLRLILTNSFHNVTLALSGVQCPGYRRVGQDYEPEPYAREAKFFLEQAILHRDVRVRVLGCDRQMLFGTVEYAGRDVGLEVIKAGLGRYVEWSGERVEYSKAYQEAEAVARMQGLRIWGAPGGSMNGSGGQQGVLPTAAGQSSAVVGSLSGIALTSQSSAPSSSSSSSSASLVPAVDFQARVTEIANSGAIRVIPEGVPGSKDPVLITFASIRVPRGDRGDSSSAKHADRVAFSLAFAGREYLRRKLIGKRVRIRHEYTKEAMTPKGSTRELPEKAYFTVWQDQTNIGVALVDQGLATVLDGSHSSEFEALLMAEERARKSHRGIHASDDKVSLYNINDLTRRRGEENKTSAAALRTVFSMLQRAGKVKAVVEWVMNAGRFKLYVPRESCMIAFQPAGLRTPRSNADDELERTMADRAARYLRDKLFQHDVYIEVSSLLDRSAAFTGVLTVNGRDIAHLLLEQGFAMVHSGGASKLEQGAQYTTIEANAKSQRKGWWRDYDEAAEAQKARDNAAARRAEAADGAATNGGGEPENVGRNALRDVVVTEVVDGNRFFMQIVGEGTAALEKLMAQLGAANIGAQPALSEKPKRGNIVCAQFSADDTWYRAKVLEVDNESYLVRYVDYGNCETRPLSRLRELPSEFSKLPHQAHEAALAYITTPPVDEEYGEDCADYLKDAALGRELKANIEQQVAGSNSRKKSKSSNTDSNIYHVILYEKDDEQSINSRMVRDGYAMVQHRRDRVNRGGPMSIINQLREAQHAAMGSRKGMFVYGDPGILDE